MGSYIFQGPKDKTEKGEEKGESDLIAIGYMGWLLRMSGCLSFGPHFCMNLQNSKDPTDTWLPYNGVCMGMYFGTVTVGFNYLQMLVWFLCAVWMQVGHQSLREVRQFSVFTGAVPVYWWIPYNLIWEHAEGIAYKQVTRHLLDDYWKIHMHNHHARSYMDSWTYPKVNANRSADNSMSKCMQRQKIRVNIYIYIYIYIWISSFTYA